MRRVRLSTALWLSTVSALSTALLIGELDKTRPAMSKEAGEPVESISLAPDRTRSASDDAGAIRSIRGGEWEVNF